MRSLLRELAPHEGDSLEVLQRKRELIAVLVQVCVYVQL